MSWRSVLLGMLLGAAGSLLLQSWSAADAPLPDGAANQPGQATNASELQRLRDELLRLRASQALDATGNREQIAATDAASATTLAAPERNEPLLAYLLLELREQLDGGLLTAHFLGDEFDLCDLVLRCWLATARQPDRALAILRVVVAELARDPQRNFAIDPDLLLAISQALSDRGDRNLAAETLQHMLRLQPARWHAAAPALARLSPAAGIQVVDELLAANPSSEIEELLRAQRAYFLIAAKRGREALEQLAQTNSGDNQRAITILDEALVEFDPALAAELFQQQLATAYDPKLDLMRGRALQAQGKRGEAGAIAEKLLAEEDHEDAAWALLQSSDPQAALRWAEQQTKLQPGLGISLRRAELLQSMGRSEEAAGALEEAWQHDPGSTAYAMLEIDPLRFASRVLELARRTRDDELIGDLGDVAWRQGKQAEATAYWQEALRLDPSDSEWQEKLRRVKAGLDPLR